MSFRTGAVIIGALAILVAALIYLHRSTGSITNYPSTGTDIVAFGDSLVFGQGASDGRDFVSLLSGRIGNPIANLGEPGNTTSDGLARISQLDTFHPKVVLLLLGGNDYLRRVPAEETFSNLGKIIENIQKRGAIVLLLGVRGGVIVDHFSSEYEKLSRYYHTAYVPDVLDGLIGDRKYMSDEVHPNDDGYKIIADRIYPVLDPLLR